MVSALNTLQQKNGLKTTQSVLNKQQSGMDAQQKANPQESASLMNMNTANAILHGKEDQLTQPKDAHETAVRMNQQTADGILHGEIPIVKKEEPKAETAQTTQPKRMSYAEMFKALNSTGEETPEQKARREKREKRNATIAAISDGLRALSNMYFAGKGAKVIHDPNSDLTAAMAKRKQLVDSQREKNKAAWLTGYQKALALDEEARKNDANLAETVRYHDQLAKNRDRVGDQKDRSLDQKDEQLNLTKYKYDTDADYKKLYLAIRKAEADGKISHWQAQDAIGRMNAETGRIRANKSGSSSSRNGSYTGEIDEYLKLMEEDPEGMKEAEREVKDMHMSTKTAAGRKAQKLIYKRRHSGKQGGSSSSNGNKQGGWASGLKLK